MSELRTESAGDAPAADTGSTWAATLLTGFLTALAIMLVSLVAVATGLV